MDLSADGHSLLIATYVSAFVFSRNDGENWQQTVSRPPLVVAVPILRQTEAACWDAAGASIIITTENLPVPVIQRQIFYCGNAKII